MTFAFGHMVGGWAVGKFFERVFNFSMSRLVWGMLIFGALLPDIDLIFMWVLNGPYHRTFTHSLLFAVLVFLGVYALASLYNSNKNQSSFNPLPIALAAFLGIIIHLIIDSIAVIGVPWFWPLPYYIGVGGVFTNVVMPMGWDGNTTATKLMVIDMGLGAIWIGYLYLTRRIKFN